MKKNKVEKYREILKKQLNQTLQTAVNEFCEDDDLCDHMIEEIVMTSIVDFFGTASLITCSIAIDESGEKEIEKNRFISLLDFFHSNLVDDIEKL